MKIAEIVITVIAGIARVYMDIQVEVIIRVYFRVIGGGVDGGGGVYAVDFVSFYMVVYVVVNFGVCQVCTVLF